MWFLVFNTIIEQMKDVVIFKEKNKIFRHVHVVRHSLWNLLIVHHAMSYVIFISKGLILEDRVWNLLMVHATLLTIAQVSMKKTNQYFWINHLRFWLITEH